MLNRQIMLLGVAGVVILLLLPIFPPFQIAIGLFTVIFLPGYAFTSALFSRARLGTSQHYLMSLVFSGSLVQLGGIIMNWGGIPLNLTTWAVYLIGSTLLFTLIALVLRRDFTAPAVPLMQVNFKAMALCSLAVILVIVAYQIARLGEESYASQGFTQLSAEYTETGIAVTMTSYELQSYEYQLFIISNGRELLHEDLTLSPQETRQIALPTTTINTIFVDLYRRDKPEAVYRQLRLKPVD